MGRLPNFVFLGPEKSGTTWLHATLSKHPDVYLTPAKDLFFFNRHYDRGLDWYRDQFAAAGAQQVVGEIAHGYLTSSTALDRIYDDLGADIKLMTTLRNPVDRAWSGYLYFRKHGVFDGSFREALEQRDQLLDSCRYATAIADVLRRYPREALHIAVFDDLERDPQSFVDALTDFLGIDRMALTAQDRQPALPAAQPRSVGLARRVRKAANWVRRRGHPQLISKLKNSPLVERALYRTVDRRAERPSSADVAYIKAALLAEIESLDHEFDLGLRARWGW